jgi:crotonobetaine/carnitine-CoA ligase
MAVSARPYGLLRGNGEPEGPYALAYEREQRSMLRVLVDQAARRGEHPWVVCDLVDSLTYAQGLELVYRVGNAVRRDAGEGAHVALFLRNQIEFLPALYGAHAANGVAVPLNAEGRGPLLEYVVAKSDATVLVVRDDLLERFETLTSLGRVETVVVTGGRPARTELHGARVVGWGEWLDGVPADPPARLPRWDEVAVIQFTSGTTGRAKGVVFPHHYLYMASAVVADSLARTEDDVLYTPMPVFHVGALHFVANSAIHAGCTAHLRNGFSPSHYWDDVAASGATFTIILAPMLALTHKLVEKPPPHRLRQLFCVPRPAGLEEIEAKFGVQVLWQGYGMTEVHPLPARRELLPGAPPTTLGHPVQWIEYGVVDDDDNLLPPGEVGELVFRSNLPHAMIREYYGDAEATVRAFRNFMFHTGDLASYDEDGVLMFRGRKVDRIRRRGEMVGAMEVELVVLTHEAVLEAAVYAVPSPLGEDDIKLDVVLGRDLPLTELHEWCRQQLPKFMVPRYYERRDSFPKTPSERIEKYKVRDLALDRPEVLDVEASR